MDKSYKKSGGYSKKITKIILNKKNLESNIAANKTDTKNLLCPVGKIKKSAYIRKNKSGKKTYVGTTCIENKGAFGKQNRTIIMNENKDLGKYGYKNIITMNKENRQNAIKKAIKAYGYLDVIRKLGAIASLQTKTNPIVSKKARNDQHFASKLYKKYKQKS